MNFRVVRDRFGQLNVVADQNLSGLRFFVCCICIIIGSLRNHDDNGARKSQICIFDSEKQ